MNLLDTFNENSKIRTDETMDDLNFFLPETEKLSEIKNLPVHICIVYYINSN